MKKHPQSIAYSDLHTRVEKACKLALRHELRWFKEMGWDLEAVDKESAEKRVRRYYKPSLGIFKAANWHFNPETLRATSFNWWPMLAVIKGKLVRNDFPYSSRTNQHQHKLQKVLDALEIKPDLTLSVRASLDSLASVRDELLYNWAREEIRAKHARVYKKNRYASQLEAAKAIGIRYTKAEKAKALQDAKDDRADRLESKRKKRERIRQERHRLAQDDAIFEAIFSRESSNAMEDRPSFFGRNFTLIQGGRL